jgi:hypothetical protein
MHFTEQEHRSFKLVQLQLQLHTDVLVKLGRESMGGDGLLFS